LHDIHGYGKCEEGNEQRDGLLIVAGYSDWGRRYWNNKTVRDQYRRCVGLAQIFHVDGSVARRRRRGACEPIAYASLARSVGDVVIAVKGTMLPWGTSLGGT